MRRRIVMSRRGGRGRRLTEQIPSILIADIGESQAVFDRGNTVPGNILDPGSNVHTMIDTSVSSVNLGRRHNARDRKAKTVPLHGRQSTEGAPAAPQQQPDGRQQETRAQMTAKHTNKNTSRFSAHAVPEYVCVQVSDVSRGCCR